MSFSWNAWSPINCGIDLLFLIASGFISRRARTWAEFRLAALLSVFPWVLGAFLLGGFLGFCLIARLLWTAATLGVPLAAIRAYGIRRQVWLGAFVVLPLALKFYGEAWEPNRLEVERVRIAIPGLKDSVRVVHISDLQTDGLRRMHERAREAANAFDPDVVVFTGDVLNHPSLIPAVEEYLQGYRHRQGAYFVTGNVDGLLPLADFCAKSGFECLDDAARILSVGTSRLAFIGLGIADVLDPTVLSRLVNETSAADARVVLSHVPDTMQIARGLPIQLLMAGHTHGGQVCLPWFGPVVTMSMVPRGIAAGGLHRLGNLQILVSRGLGWEGHITPRVRTFDRPHLLLVELVPSKTG